MYPRPEPTLKHLETVLTKLFKISASRDPIDLWKGVLCLLPQYDPSRSLHSLVLYPCWSFFCTALDKRHVTHSDKPLGDMLHLSLCTIATWLLVLCESGRYVAPQLPALLHISGSSSRESGLLPPYYATVGRRVRLVFFGNNPQGLTSQWAECADDTIAYVTRLIERQLTEEERPQDIPH